MRSFWIARYKLQLPALFPASLFLAYLIPILLLVNPTFAADGDSIAQEDQNHPRILQHPLALDLRTDSESYEPDFIGVDRSIIGRAEENDRALANNAPGQLNIEQGKNHFWTFPRQALFGPKSPLTPGLPSTLLGQSPAPNPDSSNERILYISLNTCLQPTPKDSDYKGAPEQLKLFVSTDSNNKQPSLANKNHAVPVDGGFGWLNISVKDDVYFGVSAPDNDDYTGVYNYQLTASIDGFFASYYNETNTVYIDSDTSSALLYTKNLTSDDNSNPEFRKWMDEPSRFRIFVQNQDNPSILGIQNSACALQELADVRAETAIDTGMTLAGDSKPKQQFYVRTLNASSSYYAITAIIGNSTDSGNGIVGGGGVVWQNSSFKTKSNNNCALLFNLTFCDTVAYSAPANFDNPNVADIAALAHRYDDFAKSQYVNFSRSLQQIACNTTSSAQYSLTRNCTDCDEAYRKWLCAVTIPRCEDYSNNAAWLIPRAVNQSFTNTSLAAKTASDRVFRIENKQRVYYANSRNLMIDIDIKPGPYKEVLPCVDLCYGLVQSCPASLGFVCPLERHGLNWTYGTVRSKDPANVTCSFPGAGIDGTSNAVRTSTPAALMAFGVALVVMAT